MAELAGAVAELAPTAREMGMFGAPVTVAEGASEFERLLATDGEGSVLAVGAPYWWWGSVTGGGGPQEE